MSLLPKRGHRTQHLAAPDFFPESGQPVSSEPGPPWAISGSVYALVLGLGILTGALTLISSDTLYVSGPLRWDAAEYVELTKNVFGLALNRELLPYYAQRIFPSLIVNVGHKLFHISPSDQSIIFGFQLIDCVFVIGVALLWCLISRRLRLSQSGILLGAIGLLVNFGMMKHRTYDPVLTDTTAFFLGVLMLYGYITCRYAIILPALIAGAFTWPTLLYGGSFLVLFPFSPVNGPAASAGKNRWKISWTLAGLAAGAYATTAILIYKKHFFFASPSETMKSILHTGVHAPAVNLSIALTTGYVFLGMAYLIPKSVPDYVRKAFGQLGLAFVLRVVLFALICFSVRIVQARISKAIPTSYPVLQYISVSVFSSILYPLLQVVAHIMYFGPILYLTLFYWKEAAEHAQKYLGLLLVSAFFLLCSINAESRGVLPFYPVVVLLTVMATEHLRFSISFVSMMFLLSLLFSKVWLTIGPLNLATEEIFLDNQLLFMNNGPAMSGAMYALQGSIALIVGMWLYYHYKAAVS